jgi:putative ABC transport system permease protein
MAKTLWPGMDPVGKRITFDDTTWVTVVGVTKNDVRGDWSAPPDNEMFLPFFQRRAYMNGTGASRAMTLVARVSCHRASCDATALASPIRAAIRSAERNVAISGLRSMTALADEANAEPRFYLVLLTAFAVIAVALAAVGIYGVMSYSVSRRTHEIGIRVALGADPSAVMRDVVRSGIALAGSGAVAGLVLAFGLTGMMRSILYGVRPTDAVTFSSVTSLLLGVAFVASFLPARRAARADPLTALRSD